MLRFNAFNRLTCQVEFAAADSALGNSLSGLMGSVHSPEAKGNLGDPNYGNTPQVKAPTIPVASN